MPRGVKEGSKRDRQYEHIASILRTQAVIYALRHGWIKMSEE